MPISLIKERKKSRLLALTRTFLAAMRNRFSTSSCVEPRGPVVSLTSYGYRLARVHLTIESIAAGQLKPSRLILSLDERDQALPLTPGLRRLQARGLEIIHGAPCGPHQKYFAYIQQSRSLELPLATADDDVLYPAHWLASLAAANRQAPDTIHCHRAHRVLLDDTGLAAYREWPPCQDTRPSLLNFATGVSGVIYPPRFQQWLRAQSRGFDTCCPKADDIWLHVNAVRCGMPVAQILPDPVHFVAVRGTQEGALHRHNVSDGGNDQQLRASYTTQDVQSLRDAAVGP